MRTPPHTVGPAGPRRPCFFIGRFVAVALLLATPLPWTPAPASAQGTLTELNATMSAEAELEGSASSNMGVEAERPTPEENENEAAPAPAAAAAADIEADARSFGLSISAILKLVGTFLLIYIWVLTTDWVNRDTQVFNLGYKKWNPIVFGPFAALGILFLFLPIPTMISLPVLAVAFLGSVIPYVVVHNRSVEHHQSVLTGPWWRFFVANMLRKVGVKVSTERKADYEKGAPVELLALGADNLNDNNANLISARHSPGYLLLKDLVVEMVRRRSERVRLDYTSQDVKVRHEIDGVWHAGEPMEREPGDVMLAVMKTLANCDAKERKKKQEGVYGAKYEGHSYTFGLEAQGVKSGERVVANMHGLEEQHFKSYADLGMREALAKKWSELMELDRGLLVFSALPQGGLTTVTDVSLNETDRLMRDFVSIEDVNNRAAEVQNIGVTTYDSSKGQTPDAILTDLIRTYPNVYVIRDFVNAATLNTLCKEVQDEHLVVTTVQGREAAEAPLRLLQLKPSPREFAACMTAVLYQRLVRKLCPECKVGYKPPPDVLKKLGIPAGKVEQLYRPPKPEEIEKPCKNCQGLGYRGRTGIFELLVISDQMRQVIEKQPKLELLKKLARQEQQRSLQEEGVLLVAKGVTSIPELMRVLKV